MLSEVVSFDRLTVRGFDDPFGERPCSPNQFGLAEAVEHFRAAVTNRTANRSAFACFSAAFMNGRHPGP